MASRLRHLSAHGSPPLEYPRQSAGAMETGAGSDTNVRWRSAHEEWRHGPVAASPTIAGTSDPPSSETENRPRAESHILSMSVLAKLPVGGA